MLSVKGSAKEGVKSLKKIFAKEGWDLPDVDLTDKQAMADYLKKKAEPLHNEWMVLEVVRDTNVFPSKVSNENLYPVLSSNSKRSI